MESRRCKGGKSFKRTRSSSPITNLCAFREIRLEAPTDLAVFAITLMVAACGDIAFNGSDAGNVEADADADADADAADTDSASPSDAAIDRAMVVADAATPLRRVFVTSSTFAASQMSSASPVFETADGLCAQASSKLVNPGTFRSWISDGTTSAANRDIFHPPYYDVTRSVLVFAADAKFSSAGLLSEQNEPPPASWWTGMTTTTTPVSTTALRASPSLVEVLAAKKHLRRSPSFGSDRR